MMIKTHHISQASHRAVKAIGRGAAADTWLFMDRKRNRLVAVKLFARPIPHALRDSTVREITVRAPFLPQRAFVCSCAAQIPLS